MAVATNSGPLSDRMQAGNALQDEEVGQNLDHIDRLELQVVARLTIEPHSRAVLAGDNPKTVVLGLMQPLAA
jgi:hypothetical protein